MLASIGRKKDLSDGGRVRVGRPVHDPGLVVAHVRDVAPADPVISKEITVVQDVLWVSLMYMYEASPGADDAGRVARPS